MEVRFLLLISIILITSGCVSEIRNGQVDEIVDSQDVSVCQAPTPGVDYEIKTDGFFYEHRNTPIYGAGEEITLHAAADYYNLPEELPKENLINATKISLVKIDENSRASDIGTERAAEETLCRASYQGNDTFNCSFTHEPESQINSYSVRGIEGCTGHSHSSERMSFAETVEEEVYEDSRLKLEYSNFERSEPEQGWTEVSITISFENKDISTDKAPEGTGGYFRAISDEGEDLGLLSGPAGVLPGYSDQLTATEEIRQDQEISYLLYGYNEEYLPTVAFDVSNYRN